jgi:hypothetical protein
MENTYHDLRDCYKNWDDVESESEKKYQNRIKQLIIQMNDEMFQEDNQE